MWDIICIFIPFSKTFQWEFLKLCPQISVPCVKVASTKALNRWDLRSHHVTTLIVHSILQFTPQLIWPLQLIHNWFGCTSSSLNILHFGDGPVIWFRELDRFERGKNWGSKKSKQCIIDFLASSATTIGYFFLMIILIHLHWIPMWGWIKGFA